MPFRPELPLTGWAGNGAASRNAVSAWKENAATNHAWILRIHGSGVSAVGNAGRRAQARHGESHEKISPCLSGYTAAHSAVSRPTGCASRRTSPRGGTKTPSPSRRRTPHPSFSRKRPPVTKARPPRAVMALFTDCFMNDVGSSPARRHVPRGRLAARLPFPPPEGVPLSGTPRARGRL